MLNMHWSRGVVGAISLLTLVSMGPAATYTWDGGGGNANWSTPGNWNDATGGDGIDDAPVSAADTTVVFAGTVNLSNLNQNIASPFILNRLATTSTAQTQGVSLTGGSLRFEADGATQPTLAHSRSQNLTVGNAIQVPASTTLGLSNSTWQMYLNGAITGDGSVRFNTGGGGEINFNSSGNAFTGGLFYVNTAGANGQWGRLKVSANALGDSTVTISGGNLNPYHGTTNNQPGGLILNGTATYANDFVLNATSPIFASEANGSGSNITLNGNLDLQTHSLYLRGGGSGRINGTISDSGNASSLVKIDNGTWTLAGPNTYGGPTRLSAGTLIIASVANGGSPSAIGDSSNAAANLVFDGGTLRYTGGSAGTDRRFTISSGKTATIDVIDPAATLTFSDITGSGLGGDPHLVKSGPGTLVLRRAGNGYLASIGSIAVLGGTLTTPAGNTVQLNVTRTGAANYALRLANGATLDLPAPLQEQGGGVVQRVWVQAAATTATLARSITLCGSSNAANGSIKLFDVEDGAAEIDLLAAGGFGHYPVPTSYANLTKAGAGTMSIAASSTYMGTTTVQAGRLLVNNTSGSATGSGPVVVAGGLFGGNGSVSGTVTVDGGIISAGNSPGHLALGSDYIQNAGGTMLVELGGTEQGVGYDWIEAAGQATLAGTLDINWYDGFWSHGPFIVLTAANGITNVDLSGLRIDSAGAAYGQHEWRASIVSLGGQAEGLQLELVPEPLTLLAMGLGMTGLGGYVRRRRRN